MFTVLKTNEEQREAFVKFQITFKRKDFRIM